MSFSIHHPQETDYWNEEIEIETSTGQRDSQKIYLLRVYPTTFNGYDAYMDIPMSGIRDIRRVISLRLKKRWEVVSGLTKSPIEGLFRGDYTTNNPRAWIFGLKLVTE